MQRRKYRDEFKQQVIKEALETGNNAVVVRRYDMKLAGGQPRFSWDIKRIYDFKPLVNRSLAAGVKKIYRSLLPLPTIKNPIWVTMVFMFFGFLTYVLSSNWNWQMPLPC